MIGGMTMAWYALYKWFIQFRKTPYDDVIRWYKKFPPVRLDFSIIREILGAQI